ARLAEGFDRELRIGAHNFNALDLALTVGVDLELHGHAKQVEVLGYLSDDAEALARAENRVLHLELGSAGAIHPLGKERGKVFIAILFGNGLEIADVRRLSAE